MDVKQGKDQKVVLESFELWCKARKLMTTWVDIVAHEQDTETL